MIPFDSGDKALLVSPEGIFVLRGKGAVRLLPTKKQSREHFEWLRKEYPNDPLIYRLSMEHGAISPDGKLIAAGCQSSSHYLVNADSLAVVAEIGPLSEYPHHAAFSQRGNVVAFNSCHFYDGKTIEGNSLTILLIGM